MKFILLALGTIVAASAQVTFLAALRPWGVVPNLLLVAALVAAVYLETSSAVVMALAGGLMADLASGSDFGLRMGAYGLMVLATVAVRRGGLELRRFGLLAGAVIVASISFDCFVLASLWLAGGRGFDLGVIGGRMALGAAINLALLGLIWPLASRLLGGDTVRAGVII